MPPLDLTRTTARVDPDNPDLPRDAVAGVLRWSWEHGFPEDGETVQVFDRLSGEFLAEGVWEASLETPDGRYGALLRRDGQEPWTVPGGVRTEVVAEVPRRRPGVLTEPQLGVAAELLLELAAVYRDEPLGVLADEVARTIAAALDTAPSSGA